MSFAGAFFYVLKDLNYGKGVKVEDNKGTLFDMDNRRNVITETKEKEVTLTAQIVLVAVGPKAPRRFKNTGTHASSVMLLPEPGEVPPSRLYFKLSHPLMKNRIGRHSMWLLTTPR